MHIVSVVSVVNLKPFKEAQLKAQHNNFDKKGCVRLSVMTLQ